MKRSIITMIILSILTMQCMFVSADSSDISIDFIYEGKTVTNMLEMPGLSDNVSDYNSLIEHQGEFVSDGLLVFEFSEEMDISTLTSDNITIDYEPLYYVEGEYVSYGKNHLVYEPYKVSSKQYIIDIGDMYRGYTKHTVTFTNNVRTASGNSINEIIKTFNTGRISTLPHIEGKALVNVAYQKPITGPANVNKLTAYNVDKSVYSQYAFLSGYSILNGIYCIDLGNYYNVGAVEMIYKNKHNSWDSNRAITIYASNYYSQGNLDYATKIGALPLIPDENTSNSYYVSPGGAAGTRCLNFDNTSYARYIYLNSSANEAPQFVHIIAYVDTAYGNLTAVKDGNVVNEFAGEGEYTFRCIADEYVDETGGGYMIIAGYDSGNKLTTLVCEKVEIVDGEISLSAEFNASTKLIKTCLFRSFEKPQMLTDALILE